MLAEQNWKLSNKSDVTENDSNRGETGLDSTRLNWCMRQNSSKWLLHNEFIKFRNARPLFFYCSQEKGSRKEQSKAAKLFGIKNRLSKYIPSYSSRRVHFHPIEFTRVNRLLAIDILFKFPRTIKIMSSIDQLPGTRTTPASSVVLLHRTREFIGAKTGAWLTLRRSVMTTVQLK